jgi:hypothetical protein
LTFGGSLLAWVYCVLIPSAPLESLLARKVNKHKLLRWGPALGNTLVGIVIMLTLAPWLLVGLLTGLEARYLVSMPPSQC